METFERQKFKVVDFMIQFLQQPFQQITVIAILVAVINTAYSIPTAEFQASTPTGAPTLPAQLPTPTPELQIELPPDIIIDGQPPTLKTAPPVVAQPTAQTSPLPVAPTPVVTQTDAQLFPTSRITTPILTQTGSQTLSLTLKKLEYGDARLKGPAASTSYEFSLPANWLPQEGGLIELDVDYNPNLSILNEPIFAEMEVLLNDRLLHVEPFQSTSASRKIRMGLPPEALFLSEQNETNDLYISFFVDANCEQASRAVLNIKNLSTLNFSFLERPPVLDLALYPYPIYQPNAFEPNHLYILHSARPSAGELQAISLAAAKLGEVIGTPFSITTTTAISATESQVVNSHVLIVGSPESNPLIAQLPLPIPAIKRQLNMWSEMPAVAVRNQPFAYTLNVQNASTVTQTLRVIDRLPLDTTFTHCSGNCRQTQAGFVEWQVPALAPGAKANTTVRVTINDTIPPDQSLAHIATLYDSNNTLINTDSLAVGLGLVPSEQFVSSFEQKGAYFFAKDGLEVAENDGLVQEIQSPWSKKHVAIIVTGLNDQALYKAGQALGGQNRFPGMAGQYAIIQDTQPFTQTDYLPPQTSFTLADLGIQNKTFKIQGGSSIWQRYKFDVPPNWEVSEGAYFDLHLAYSPAFSEISSTLNVALNRTIVAGATLNNANAFTNTLRLPLPPTTFKPGRNRLEISVSTALLDECTTALKNRYWLTIFNDSSLVLPHETLPILSQGLDMELYTRPFTAEPDFKDLVFVLPRNPSEALIQKLVRMMYILGYDSNTTVYSFNLVFAGQSTFNDWRDHHIIAIGLPTTNNFIAEANDLLPQPFQPGTNQLKQQVDNVIYRLPPGFSLGLIQELVSPVNVNKAMLTVTGTNEEGLSWALAALGNDQTAFSMAGNLAFVRGAQIDDTDTRFKEPTEMLASAQSVVPELQPVATAVVIQPTPTTISLGPEPSGTPPPEILQPEEITVVPETVSPTQPGWLRPLLIFSIVLLVLAVGAAIWQSRA